MYYAAPEYKWIDEFLRLFLAPSSLDAAFSFLWGRIPGTKYSHELLWYGVDFGKARDSSDPLFIGLWKCYDKNIVKRERVDFPHFYWQKCTRLFKKFRTIDDTFVFLQR